MKLFADFKRLAGTDNVELVLPEPSTVGDVVEATRAKFPPLRNYAKSTLVAKGMEYAGPSDPVSDGDEISLMPPVMGG